MSRKKETEARLIKAKNARALHHLSKSQTVINKCQVIVVQNSAEANRDIWKQNLVLKGVQERLIR